MKIKLKKLKLIFKFRSLLSDCETKRANFRFFEFKVEIEGSGVDHPFLGELKEHLMSRHGRGRSEREANQIVTAVSKFLCTYIDMT